MRDCSPLLYFDNEGHIWKFYIKDSGELIYSIMYEEDKWTNESKIDSEVLNFTANVNIQSNVYIIYSNKESELKYCIWENNQWSRKTLYTFEKFGYLISELTVHIIEKNMHIFCIVKNISKKRQCALMHFSWSNEKNIFNSIYNIAFMQEDFSYYQVELLKDGGLCLLLIHKHENELAIKLTEYKDGKWGIPKRLYGINGSNINFCSLQHNSKINILNLSREASTYSLEHVVLEADERMNSNKIYESSVEVSNNLLLKSKGILWAMWSEGEKVYASYYKGQWSEPILCDDKINNQILLYRYLSLSDKYKKLKAKYIWGTILPEIEILLPEYENNEEERFLVESKPSEIEDEKVIILKKSNRNLEKRLLDLQLQHQQKQRIIEESDENFVKLTNAKKKAEEKLKIVTEVHQLLLKELENIKNQNVEKDNAEAVLKTKLHKLSSESQQLKAELEEIKSQNISKDKTLGELKSKLNQLSYENEQLKIELKYENNKGIMDRILKKKLEKL